MTDSVTINPMKRPQPKSLLFLVAILVGLINCSSPSTEYDVIISGGQVYDGSGSAPERLDIGLRDDRIVAIGDLSGESATETIDATGLAVAPGFIDVHAHLDPVMRLPGSESHVRQGVTTALGGPDGSSPWPLKDYMDSLASIGIGMNIGYTIGHNTIRRNIMNMDDRAPTEQELDTMKALISQAMADGAFGISTGLKYLPGAFSEVEEVIALSEVAARQGGFYTSHLREEGLGLLDAVKEAIVIGREANIPIVLTHHKVIGKAMWGASVQSLALVDSAREVGIDVMMDQYPYIASHTGISVLIPPWARAGGNDEFKKRVQDPILYDSIKNGIVFNILNDRGGADLRRIQFSIVNWKEELQGKTLHDWLEMEGKETSVENGADFVIQAQVNGGASCVYFAMDDADVDRIMAHPQTMIASDGRLAQPGDGHPHPRWYGTFPRVLGHYARERGVITLEEAIKKMTSMPAARLGLKQRGEVKVGHYADIVIFNPETVIDKATFDDPHQYPEGIEYVIINGQITVKEGVYEDLRPGKVLRFNQQSEVL